MLIPQQLGGGTAAWLLLLLLLLLLDLLSQGPCIKTQTPEQRALVVWEGGSEGVRWFWEHGTNWNQVLPAGVNNSCWGGSHRSQIQNLNKPLVPAAAFHSPSSVP